MDFLRDYKMKKGIIMENFESKNTVKSENQVSKYVLKSGKENGNPKILFLGNSITRHEPAPQIGWYGDWGMAASDISKDYVHICMKDILTKYPDSEFCLVQGSSWERTYRDCNFDEFFASAKDFNPNVIICLISENVINEDFDKDVFIEQLHRFHEYLSNGNKKTKIIVASNFFNNEEKTNAIDEYAKKYGAEFVNVSDLIKDEKNLASGYKHEGIKIHPGDKGMEIIASRIMKAFYKISI
jgi:hypothetical protein